MIFRARRSVLRRSRASSTTDSKNQIEFSISPTTDDRRSAALPLDRARSRARLTLARVLGELFARRTPRKARVVA
jgi:hypothetical protein